MRHKSEDKIKEEVKNFKSIDIYKAKQQIPTNDEFVRKTKKCLTNFNLNRTKQNMLLSNMKNRLSSS